MGTPVPAIDKRTATDVAKQVERLLKDTYLQDFPNLVPPQGVSAAMIGIFGRFAEIIIQRLNKVPEKNLLAFMDLLGASLLPPQSARAPLTFSLATGSTVDSVVPVGTQVAAQPAEDETQPVIFETGRNLVVTAARLDSVFVRDPTTDRYSDCGVLASGSSQSGMPSFQGEKRIEHILYIGDSRLLGLPNIIGLTLTITFAAAPEAKMKIGWELWDGSEWKGQDPQTEQMAEAVRTIAFGGVLPVPLSEVNEVESRWLRGRLLTPITQAQDQIPGYIQARQLPEVKSIGLSVTVGGRDLPIEAAFANGMPVDLTKDFYPFGEKPNFGDVLYTANGEAFSENGAVVTLAVTLTNPTDAASDQPLPRTRADGSPSLVWECWDGVAWLPLGTALSGKDANSPGFSDTTQALTKSGSVTLTLPKQSGATTIGGTESKWLRVRIVSGNYGQEAKYIEDSSTKPSGYKLIPATFAPPSIKSIKVSYTLSKTAGAPEKTQTYNDFSFEEAGDPLFAPFMPTKDTQPSIYFGFSLPAPRTTFPNSTLSLYVDVPCVVYGSQPDNPAPSAPPRLVWEMGIDSAWAQLTVHDETQALTTSGVVEFLPPDGTALRREFGQQRYWLRARWIGGEYRFNPGVQRVLLNTTMASQMESLSQEILGSSDGGGNLRFQTTRKPVLDGQHLGVREMEIPSVEEQALIRRDEGEDAISITYDETGQPTDIWVRWHEVPDFYGSGPRSRHYVLNHLTGEVAFGNGSRGLIPPVGSGNIRMLSYRTGGGVSGNKPADSITQLKTTIPYVDKANNAVAASGGSDSELVDALLERAPRTIRHRGRAVTKEDYEDLALLASSEVERAMCVPLRNLVDDPLDEKSTVPGNVSVIIVPHSNEDNPQPGVELVRRVQEYLSRYSVPTAAVFVVGSLYIRVDVTAEIAVTSLDLTDEVERVAYQRLKSFLHPLTGGLNGTGWDFGREPHVSDLYALLGAVPGVDHVDYLAIRESSDPSRLALEKVKSTGRFLVYSGMHQVRLVFE